MPKSSGTYEGTGRANPHPADDEHAIITGVSRTESPARPDSSRDLYDGLQAKLAEARKVIGKLDWDCQ